MLQVLDCKLQLIERRDQRFLCANIGLAHYFVFHLNTLYSNVKINSTDPEFKGCDY